MKKCLAIILALVMAFGCMSVAAFAAGSPDLSMLTTGTKIQLGTYASGDNQGNPVEWVIGGDGTTGMSVPTGCIALVTSDLVTSDYVVFDYDSNMYATSNLKTVVEGAVTFTDDEQAAIQSRTLQGGQTIGADCDGVAGDTVIAKVWAPTTKDAYALNAASLSAASFNYWLCSPGNGNDAVIVRNGGSIWGVGTLVNTYLGVRAALYLDLSKVYGAEAVSGAENTYTLVLTAPTFLTSFTLNKDYNDKYITDAKTTKVNETVTFTITPITENAPEFETDTFTITVTDGVGSADVDLPGTDDIDSVGDYWYKIEETEGTTAGVTYNDTTYYLHLIVSYKNGEFGFSSAVVRSSNDVTATDGEYPTTGKIDTVSNTYGEGSLTVAQETTVNGEESSEDTFTAKVTFTPAEGTDDVGTITYGDGQTVTKNTDGKYVVEVELKGGESVTFNNIPDGVTYTVEQSESNEDKGYTLDSVEFDNDDEDGDTVTDLVASGTIGDTADTVTISNSKTVPVDVGVIVEYTAFIILALGAVAAGAWLVISRRRKTIEAE